MSIKLDGRIAIVTGASRGIGLAIAQRLAADGARVCITARHADALAEAENTFPEGAVMSVAGRVDDADHRKDVLARTAAEFGGVDILVNNAGINPISGELRGVELSAARKIMEVNLLSTLAWSQAALRAGLGSRHGGGSIVNLSSVTGSLVWPDVGWYGVTKAAIEHLTRTLAVELGPLIRVNAVAPAVVKTRFAGPLFDGREDEVAAEYPLQRLGVPDDVAGAVAFLVSSDAAWITGQVLTVDGGVKAGKPRR